MFTYCCLVLPITCIALPSTVSGHATGGACVLIRTCWGLRQRLVATWAEFQHSVVYYSTERWRKRLEACISAEGGHFEHLLWYCLPDIPVATHHNRLFHSHRRQPTTGSFQSLQSLKERNKPSVRWKSFAVHKSEWWHFQVEWRVARWIIDCFACEIL